MTSDVFPARNLGQESEPWGRELEELTRSNSYRIDNIETSSRGDNRATAGQMGALGRQVEELRGRLSVLRTPGSISITPPAGGMFVSATAVANLPPPEGGARAAFISVTGRLSDGSDSLVLFLDINAGGEIISRGRALQTSSLTAPAGFSPMASSSAIVLVPASGLDVNITMWGARLGGGVVTATFDDIKVNAIYADRD